MAIDDDCVEIDDDYVATDDDCVGTDDDCAEIGDDDYAEADDDYVETDDDEYVADDATVGYEVIVNAADGKETDDVQHAFVGVMELIAGGDVADVEDDAVEDVVAVLDDHDVAVIKKFVLIK